MYAHIFCLTEQRRQSQGRQLDETNEEWSDDLMRKDQILAAFRNHGVKAPAMRRCGATTYQYTHSECDPHAQILRGE